ncbi:MAG: hypothetical protein AAF721_16090 [Myxococcota bacterium]
MRNSALTLLAGLMAMPLVACTGSSSDGTPDRRPFRDEWRVEADVPFVHTDSEGMLQIGDITIGGREFNDNFANRGDVIVNFDGPADKILVEFRRFTTNTSPDAAELDFDAMSLWAFNSGVGQPTKPDQVDPEADCVAGGWLAGCGVRVYYDGQTQLARAGVDIRVTLPSDYRRTVNVITEDADEDGDYLNRGNVCVNGSNGTVDVEMQSGKANIIVSDDATPAPICGLPPNTKSNPSPEIQMCDDLMVMGAASPWDTNPGDDGTSCPCSMTGEYGVVKVESDASASTDITVDLPAGLWSSITVENLGDTPDDCTGQISVPGLIQADLGNEFPWEAKGSVSLPSDAIVPGVGGYNIQARSGQCGPVAFTEDPSDFVGVNNGSMQDNELRGNVEVCTDCIRASSCDDLNG